MAAGPERPSAFGALEFVGPLPPRSLFGWYPYDAADGREALDAGDDVGRVLRGGSFFDSEGYVRCAVRLRDSPSGGYGYRFGFRVVASPFKL